MYRLLIIDDEPAIVEGLVQLFEENGQMDLDVWKATSAVDALKIIKSTRIDIILSDIRMPEKNGLQLIDEVLSYWPSCKIIFLTGYSEFEYAYAAFQKNVENYILKHEDDAALTAAVQAVVDKLDLEKKNEDFLKQAEEKMKYVEPLVKKQLFEALLAGEPIDARFLHNGPTIRTNMELPVILLIGYVPKWSKKWAYENRLQAHYAIQNRFQTMLTPLLLCEETVFERSLLVWFIQPNVAMERLNTDDQTADWKATVTYLKGILESVQNACKEELEVDVTFLISREAVQWQEAYREFDLMKSFIRKRDWLAPNMTVIDLNSVSSQLSPPSTWAQLSDSNRYERLFRQLEKALKENEAGETEQRCREIFPYIKRMISDNYLDGFHKYLSVVLLYISHAGNTEISVKLNMTLDMERLSSLHLPHDWEAEEQFFVELGHLICQGKRERLDKGQYELIDKVERFIDDHLGEDLSLIKMADIVHMNPSYFSRFYKQQTGRNISDYIHASKMNAAKRMLLDAKFKVQDIAVQLGFTSPSYFSIFFKKLIGVTPQEYKEAAVKESMR